MKTSRRQLICFYVARVVKIANLITTSIKTIIFFFLQNTRVREEKMERFVSCLLLPLSYIEHVFILPTTMGRLKFILFI